MLSLATHQERVKAGWRPWWAGTGVVWSPPEGSRKETVVITPLREHVATRHVDMDRETEAALAVGYGTVPWQ